MRVVVYLGAFSVPAFKCGISVDSRGTNRALQELTQVNLPGDIRVTAAKLNRYRRYSGFTCEILVVF
jgi:hypothetical protein